MSHPTPSQPNPLTPNQAAQKQAPLFTQEEMDNIIRFYQALKKVYVRLQKEGYRISDDQLIPPTKKAETSPGT